MMKREQCGRKLFPSLVLEVYPAILVLTMKETHSILNYFKIKIYFVHIFSINCIFFLILLLFPYYIYFSLSSNFQHHGDRCGLQAGGTADVAFLLAPFGCPVLTTALQQQGHQQRIDVDLDDAVIVDH